MYLRAEVWSSFDERGIERAFDHTVRGANVLPRSTEQLQYTTLCSYVSVNGGPHIVHNERDMIIAILSDRVRVWANGCISIRSQLDCSES
jgi:hypothetical protein